MTSANFFVFSAVLLMTFGASSCGQCESIPTVANFNKTRFNGAWTSILESADPRLPCLHYRLEATADSMKCTFLPYNLEAYANANNATDLTQGFKISMSLKAMNGANWNIFDTDYENYAGIFTCKETDDVHYHSVTFWTRTGKTLSAANIKHMKDVLDKYNIPYSTLENIPQDGQFIKWCSIGSTLVEPATKVLVPLLTKILG